jgi:oligopeptide transport system permease protein
MLEVTRKDYIRTAHSKGLPDQAVVSRHMIRNALIPVITILGPTLAFLVTGSFIIERIFGIPGIGQFYITSISTRDYSLLMAMTMLYAFAVAFLNVVVDVLYAYIDPRIRYSEERARWRQTRPSSEHGSRSRRRLRVRGARHSAGSSATSSPWSAWSS